MNSIWELDSEHIAAYTENLTIMHHISKYPVMATYYRAGKMFAIQYKVPSQHEYIVSKLLQGDYVVNSNIKS